MNARSLCLALCNQRAPEHVACRGGTLPPCRADVPELSSGGVTITTTCHPACLLFAAFSAKLPARDRVNSFGPTLDGGAHYRLQRWAGAAPVEVHYYHACLSACLLIFSGCHLCTFCCRRLFAKTFFSLRGSNSGEA